MSKRRGRAFWLLTALAAGLVALFVRLAVWQYHRAQEREAQIRDAAAARHEPAAALSVAGAAGLPRFSRVYAEGRYDAAHQVLLSEMPQPDGDGTGYEVLTPLVLPGGTPLLVDRGWIPQGETGEPRADLAAPAGTVRATGYLADLPAPGLRLGSDRAGPAGWPARLLYPRWSDLQQLYGTVLVRRLLLLEPDAQGGYDRAWQLRPEHGPGENYSYMVQWLGFAVTLIVIWFVLAFRSGRTRTGDDGGE